MSWEPERPKGQTVQVRLAALFFVAPESHNELGTGASRGVNGSSSTCGSTSKNNRECLHSCFVFRVEERCYYTCDFLCSALGLELKNGIFRLMVVTHLAYF